MHLPALTEIDNLPDTSFLEPSVVHIVPIHVVMLRIWILLFCYRSGRHVVFYFWQFLRLLDSVNVRRFMKLEHAGLTLTYSNNGWELH